MKNKFKLYGISAALVLSMLLTGCSDNAEQPNDLSSPNSQSSVSSSQSESTNSSSSSSTSSQSSKTGSSSSSSKPEQSSETQSTAEKITINDDVVWGLGKTLDELKEKYGEIKGDGGPMSVYTFENGYGRYGINDGICTVIDGINTSDILKGNFSVMSYKDLENRAGISYGRIDDNPDPMDNCWWAFFVHPSYNGVTFAVYSQTARDEIKADTLGVRIWTK